MKEIFNKRSDVSGRLQGYAAKLVLGGEREGEEEREREGEGEGGREREKGERERERREYTIFVYT